MMMRTATVAAFTTTLLVLGGCGASSGDSSTEDGWAYEDGRGHTVELDRTPKQIVAQTSLAAALNDLGVDVDTVFGPLTLPDGSVDPQAAGLDPDEVTDVTAGGEYGSLDLEELAASKPELLITYMVVPPDLWYVNAATEKKVDKLVPTLALNFQDRSTEETVNQVNDLASALGADVDSPQVKKNRAAFDAAAERLETIGTKLGDRKILAVSTTPDLFYAGDPTQFQDLSFYQSLGLPIVAVESAGESYWHELSWENSDTYDADIVLWDQRGGEAAIEKLRSDPVFSTVTAAREDAFVPWNAVAPPSWRANAEVMNTLADRLEKYL